jgi:hypothetical protein
MMQVGGFLGDHGDSLCVFRLTTSVGGGVTRLRDLLRYKRVVQESSDRIRYGRRGKARRWIITGQVKIILSDGCI